MDAQKIKSASHPTYVSQNESYGGQHVYEKVLLRNISLMNNALKAKLTCNLYARAVATLTFTSLSQREASSSTSERRLKSSPSSLDVSNWRIIISGINALVESTYSNDAHKAGVGIHDKGQLGHDMHQVSRYLVTWSSYEEAELLGLGCTMWQLDQRFFYNQDWRFALKSTALYGNDVSDVLFWASVF